MVSGDGTGERRAARQGKQATFASRGVRVQEKVPSPFQMPQRHSVQHIIATDLLYTNKIGGGKKLGQQKCEFAPS